jgi:hypothetical protein
MFHIRYWDPLLSHLFTESQCLFVRYDPKNLAKVWVPIPDRGEYLAVPYADLRRAPISQSEQEAATRDIQASGRRTANEDAIFSTIELQRKLRAALNVLKFLSNELRVSIVGLGTSEALHVMRTDPQIASRFESCALPSWTANEDLRSFLAGFLQQLEVDGSDIVNNRIAIEYVLELTSGVTGRIVELLRLSARCAMRRDSGTVNIELLQEAGKEFAADLGSERNVSH